MVQHADIDHTGLTGVGSGAAADVTFDPTGLDNTAATDVQAALEDFDAAISAAGGGGGSTVPNLILDFTLGSDINGVSLTQNTWVDILANQNFTVANASSLIEISIRGYAFNSVAVGQCGTRLVIDSAGTPINEQLHSTNFQTNGVGNLFATGSVFISGLSAATHTIKLQAFTANATPGAIYCRASANPPLEFLRIQIVEHLPA